MIAEGSRAVSCMASAGLSDAPLHSAGGGWREQKAARSKKQEIIGTVKPAQAE